MFSKVAIRRMRWLAAASFVMPVVAQAQFTSPAAVPQQPVIVPLPQSNDPADRLSANLLVLSQNPRDVNALIGAGRSAIAVGDGHAALSFLARAEELSPGDPRIKAHIGSALLLLEQPGEAIKLFDEAASMGLPDREMASDRGLAHDLMGDTKRAQRDYQAALRNAPTDETTRRLALSLGISGERDAGLKLLDPLIRKQDQGAWRARAFILAMNGQLKDAEKIANQVMPYGMAETLTPFLRRLSALNPAQRARAVNFGSMPDTGLRTAMASASDSFRPLDAGAADRLIPVEPTPVAQLAAVAPAKGRRNSKEPRRRPGRENVTLATATPAPRPEKRDGPIDSRIDSRVDTRVAAIDPSRLPPEVRRVLDAQRSTVRGSSPPPVRIVPPPPPPVRVAQAELPPAPVFEIPAAPIVRPLPPVLVTPPPAPVAPTMIREAALPPSTSAPPPLVTTTTAQSQTPVFLERGSPAPPPPPPPPIMPLPAPAPPPAPPPTLPPAPVVQTVIASPPQSATADLVPAAAGPPTLPPREVLAVTPPPPPPSQAVIEPVQAKPETVGLAAVMSGIVPEEESRPVALPTMAELRAMRAAAQKKADAEAKAKAEKEAKVREAAEAAATAKRHPARVWVQVATGANEAGLPGTWKKLRDKAPDVFKGQSASVVPFKATNRVLVGPFKSQAEARTLVNAMGKVGIQGSTYASDAGQEVKRIAVK